MSKKRALILVIFPVVLALAILVSAISSTINLDADLGEGYKIIINLRAFLK